MVDQKLDDLTATGSIQGTDFVQVSRVGTDSKELASHLFNRANHTGTQLASTISDFQSAVSSNTSVSANTAKVTNANHTGDVTGATALTIAADAVTYAKIQNVSATDKLLGRSTAGAGDVEEIPLTAAGRALIDDADAAAQRATLVLGNVNNTSDANKPVSTATQTALDLKSDKIVSFSNNAFSSITPGLSDANTIIRTTSASAVTITVPTNASVNFATGDTIAVFQQNVGLVTFAAAVGVTINSFNGLLSLGGQYTSAVLLKVSVDTWDLVGNLA